MRLALSLSVATAVALAVVGAAIAAARPAAGSTTVTTARTGLGVIVVDHSGRSLYLFEKDKHGASACSGACAAYWPPLLTRGTPTAAGGARASLLGVTRRADGTRQVTYAGHPLYRFAGDTRRGQTQGEGSHTFGAGWDALTPAGHKIERDG